MKKIVMMAVPLLFLQAGAQTLQLKKIWETDSIIAIPESVLPELNKGVLYLSLIDGNPWEADGKGGIGKLAADGKKYDSTWITGLNAPKGMARYGNRLYVADISEVTIIDIQNVRIEKKISIDSANGLNDITVDDNGIIYVSDSRTAKVWRIEHDIPSLYLDNLQGVNGLKAVGHDLFIGAGKSFIKADEQKNFTVIASLPEAIDGIEPLGNGDFILSSWTGYIYYVSSQGKVDILLDSHAEKINTADIGIDPVKKIIYVPTFFAKKIIAYQLLSLKTNAPPQQKNNKKIKGKRIRKMK